MGQDTLKMPNNRPEIRSEAKRPEVRIDPTIMAAIENEGEGNPFYFDTNKKPVDMTYEFKRLTYGGLEDKPYQSELKRKGWVAVPASRHSECGTEDPAMNHIIIGGQILMERHQEYTKRAREITANRNSQLVNGQFDRLQLSDNPNMPRKVTKLQQTYEVGQEIPA